MRQETSLHFFALYRYSLCRQALTDLTFSLVLSVSMNVIQCRRVAIRILSFGIGFVFLLYGLILIPTGLFVGEDILIAGFLSFAIGYRFLANGSKEMDGIKHLRRLTYDAVLLTVGSLCMAFWSWAESEIGSVTVWSSLMTSTIVLSILSTLEWRGKAQRCLRASA
jgi:hypothetical protein